VLDWYKELYAEAMEPEVLSWDERATTASSSPARLLDHRPREPVQRRPEGKRCRSPTTSTITTARPAPPAALGAGLILGMALEVSKNVELAKEFIQFLFKKENYDAWTCLQTPSTIPPLRHLATIRSGAQSEVAMLPKEAEFGHPRGGRPSRATPYSGSTTTT